MTIMAVWASIGSAGTLETIGRIISIIIGTCAIILGFAKYVALPWLEKNLVRPVEEVNTQVTVNSHKSDPATLLDTVHVIEQEVTGLKKNMHDMAVEAVKVAADTGVIKNMWDHHMDWSSDEVKRIWHAIENLQDNKENKRE